MWVQFSTLGFTKQSCTKFHFKYCKRNNIFTCFLTTLIHRLSFVIWLSLDKITILELCVKFPPNYKLMFDTYCIFICHSFIHSFALIIISNKLMFNVYFVSSQLRKHLKCPLVFCFLVRIRIIFIWAHFTNYVVVFSAIFLFGRIARSNLFRFWKCVMPLSLSGLNGWLIRIPGPTSGR